MAKKKTKKRKDNFGNRKALCKRVGFGTKLREAMASKGLSSYRMSKKTGLFPSYMNLLCDDAHDPRLSTMVGVAQALGFTVNLTLQDKKKASARKKAKKASNGAAVAAAA
jgi:transcriptional regulator with XRE-family HTH domain